MTSVRRAADGLRYVLYYGLATRLPRSYGVGGPLAARLRRALVTPLLARAGEDVNIEAGAVFGSGAQIVLGARSGLGVDADIHGPVTIGDDVMMGPRCTILTRNHRIDDVTVPMNQQGFGDYHPVVIEDDVWIGANVTIMPGVRVGTGSVLAAGAVVAHDVPPFSIVGGVPAKVLRDRREALPAAAADGVDARVSGPVTDV